MPRLSLLLSFACVLAANCADTPPGCQSCGMKTSVARAAKKGKTSLLTESENSYSDKNLVIQAGDTVTWTNIGVEDHTTTSDTGLWDSGRMKPGQTFSHTFKVPGTYPYNCVYHKSMGMTGTVTVNPPPPAISSPLTAVGAVGAPFLYRIDAATADTYAATPLPPGLMLSGNAIVGTPAEPNMYAVAITAGNITGSDTQSLLIQIVNTIKVSDQDGDGFTDALEIAAGSLPTDASSTPFGILASGSTPLTVTKLSIKLNFARPGSDTIKLQGTLLIPDQFKSAGQQTAVDIGGVSALFTLDDKGLGKSGAGSFKLNVKSQQGLVFAQHAPFSISLSKGAFAQSLSAIGLDGLTTQTKVLKTVSLTLLFNGARYDRIQIVTYTVRANRSGMAK
jgi:plastocyanin